MLAGAQSTAPPQAFSAADTHARGYWLDASTNLMWTGTDNGFDIKWKQAIKYCRDLRLASYGDWRLPTIDQLEGIYDGSGSSAPVTHPGAVGALGSKPKGGLSLTGARQWSNDRVKDARGHASGFAWEFDYPHGRRWKDPTGYYGMLRALCVRNAGN